MNNPIILLIQIYHYLNKKEVKTDEEYRLTVNIEIQLDNFLDSDRNFEDHMQELHGQNYEGLDDDMPDRYDEWRGDFTLSELIEEYEDYIS